MYANEGIESHSDLLLVEEITHRVINDYTIAVATLNRAARLCDDPTAKASLSVAKERFLALAATHRALLAPPPEKELDVDVYIARICMELCESILAEKKIMLHFRPCEVSMRGDRCWRLGLILAELIRNAARHGANSEMREIGVELHVGTENLYCAVTNAGHIRNQSRIGAGRRIVIALVAECGGQVDWEVKADKTTVWLRLPLRHSGPPPPKTRSDTDPSDRRF